MRIVNLCLFIILLTASSATRANVKTMNISIVNDSPVLLWYKKYIEHAYNLMQYRVAFRQLPAGRGAVEANKGNIDALTIRTSVVEASFPDFVRVPILLAKGKLMLYCQHNIECNEAIVNQTGKTIGTVAGVNVTMLYMADKKANIYEVASGFKVAEMFQKNRLDYILTINSPDFGNYVSIEHGSYQEVTLMEINAYHYIHKRHSKMLPELEKALSAAVKEIGSIPKSFVNRVTNE